MTIRARALFDPELVVPSSDSVTMLRFWARLDRWTQGDLPYIGPETLRAVGELLADPPVVYGLAARDLLRITGRVASRVLKPADPRETCCSEHVMANYRPSWGHEDNGLRLEMDVAAFPVDYTSILATDRSAWEIELPELSDSCAACAARPVYFQIDPSSAPAEAWRAELRREGLTLADLEAHSSRLFPNLEFATGAWANSADAVSGGVSIDELLIHLAVLSDSGASIWADYVDTRMRQQQLATRGVEASPESPRTRRNKAAIAARTFDFRDQRVSCQWHTKLSPTQGRVHFAVEGGRVLIGAIVSHLPT